MNPEIKKGPDVSIKEMLTDPKAIIDGVVPPILFVTVNSFTDDLVMASVAAGGFGVAVAIYRLVKRQKINYVLGGLLGLGISIFIAMRTGKASNYFLPNTIIGFVYGGVALISVLVARPLSAVVAKIIEEKPKEWYRQSRVRNAHLVVTAAWALFFLGRAGFRAYFISIDRAEVLAATAVLLGFPATAVLTVGSWAYLKWRLSDVPAPVVEAAEEPAADPTLGPGES